jgi:transaldolase
MNQLDALKLYSTVVADTGDFQQIARFQPQDATTNPSLILKAVQMPAYQQLLQDTRAQHTGAPLDVVMDHLLVKFGCSILALIPGRVSTEVDVRQSFDTEATVARAQRIMDFYHAQGIHKSRVLIKIAATWEGIQAAARLEREGIHTNLTLLFSFTQAVACADAGVKLISPFVGRIYDWYKKSAGSQWDEAANAGARDPGVQSVARIYNYYKKHGIKTEVMGASFRNTGQIIALAGCDLLTISPELLAQLQSTELEVQPALSRDKAAHMALPEVHLHESSFRFAMNDEDMAHTKLAEGIRAFCSDTEKLDTLLLK